MLNTLIRRTRPAWALIAAVAVGAFLGRRTGPKPTVEYREVQVPVEVITRDEPDTVVKVIERVVWRTAPAKVIAVAPEGAVSDVRAFCGSAGWSPPGSNAVNAERVEQRRALVRSESFDGKKLKNWLVLSDGTLAETTRDVRAPFRWTVAGDSLFVQEDRWSWAKTAAKYIGVLGVGISVGALIQ